MRLIYPLIIAISLIANVCSAAELPPSFADLVEKLTPTVVNVSTTQKVKTGMSGNPMLDMQQNEIPPEFREFFEQFAKPQGEQQPQEREAYSLGSGFIIDENGYVVTNNHVIADAEEITVILSDDTKLKAKIIGRDAKTDLALLKVEAGKKLPFAAIGNSDASRVGDWVIAIGNPFGLGGTVTAGIISARARNINAGPFDDFIQTDAAINRGNSGGPMFNMKGEVIGINTAILSPSGGSIGIGFAVPSSMAKPILTQLKNGGHINRGWLGVSIQNVTDEIADSLGMKKAAGALVMGISKGSPADKAGILVGDIITKFDGKEVKEMRFLPRLVAETDIGKTTEIEVLRKGSVKTLKITLGKLQEQEEASNKGGEDNANADTEKSSVVLGMSLNDITPELRSRYKLAEDVPGVLISKIAPTSQAARRGVKAGDVIVGIGDIAIESSKDVAAAIAELRKSGRKFALLRIIRGKNTTLFTTIPLEEKK
ncbi:MAG: DegQ family serine endoprotease [Pseudomonadota bacterium]